MKKRLLSILTVVICFLLLSGCSSQEQKDPDVITLTVSEQQQWLDASVTFTESLKAAAEEGADITVGDDPVYGPAFENWRNALPEIGTVEGITGESVEFTKNDGRIVVHVDGSSHDAEVVLSFIYEAGSYALSSVTVNILYSFAELMQQAGLNTLLGMGTTFAVLILLAVIILLFGKVLNRSTESKAPPAPAAAPAAPVQTAEAAGEIPAAQPEDLTADLALVAVIAAAVAASEGRETAEGLVVRSIRKSRKKF